MKRNNNNTLGILISYVASAGGIVVILLLLNLAIAAFFVVTGQFGGHPVNMERIASGLSYTGDGWQFSEPDDDPYFTEYYLWAMLLDENGSVVWSQDLPDEIPLHYTASEIASFSRWYLMDYPVLVWGHGEGGLFVMGTPRDSMLRLSGNVPMRTMDAVLVYVPLAVLLSILLAFVLALLFGLRLIRSVRPVDKAISQLAEGHPVELAEKGMLRQLCQNLNHTSQLLKKQKNQLEKRDQARTDWISGISHDIRTPLSMVMGHASQLEDDQRLPENQRRQAGVIRSQSEKIRNLIQDLNLVSRLQYEMEPLQTTVFSPLAATRSAAADFLNLQRDTLTHPVELSFDGMEKNLQIAGDPNLFRRALDNLLQNSQKHNPDGCLIRISGRLESCGTRNDQGSGADSLTPPGVWLALLVEDNGRGYPEDVLAAFEHAHQSRPAFGLGLSIVSQIARAHGGGASFSNQPDGGSSALLWLPVD